MNRYLARSGLASRRKSEEIILSGRVKINGKTIKDLSTNIDIKNDSVIVDGKLIKIHDHKYYLLNKPTGYTCTRKDRFAKKTVFDLLPKDDSLFTVGRLDKETSGLILITNDGDFAQNIIHPKFKVPKKYIAELENDVKSEDIKHLLTGVKLEDGPAKAISAKTINPREIEVTIEEGRNRIVRRMIRGTGNKVLGLKRISVGNIKIDIKEGEFRELTEKEIAQYA
ncbi:MAG: pseudouridine synthase [Patescibacteria group bacterium]|nr:pseudouridine synthase [Patescibacteria group bacterium]